jgi:hypothetical protein
LGGYIAKKVYEEEHYDLPKGFLRRPHYFVFMGV